MKELPSPDDLNSIRHLVNNQPIPDFCELSSNEMHSLLYHPLEEQSPVKLKTVPEEFLQKIPFFRLMEEFLKIIQREKSIKTTPLGYLQRKVISELYAYKFITSEMVERGVSKLNVEDDWSAIHAIHSCAVLAGWMRKTKGKYVLTKAGTRILETKHRSELFSKLLETYTEKFPWSDLDGYSPVPVGNLGWGFTIILLLKFGDEPRSKDFYAEKYITAFPDFVHHFPTGEYNNPHRDVRRCYMVRSFDRFLLWWGIVEYTEKRREVGVEISKIIATPLLKQLFSLEE